MATEVAPGVQAIEIANEENNPIYLVDDLVISTPDSEFHFNESASRASKVESKENAGAGSFFSPAEYSPSVKSTYKNGFFFESNCSTLAIGGYVQADFRQYIEHAVRPTAFLIRRARINIEGTYQNTFRCFISANWTISTVNLNKAFLDTLGPKYARFMMGLFNEPFSMEALLPDEAVDFIERTPGTFNFIQTQDAGAMVYGALFADRFNYAFGIFNGTDHREENNSDKEYVGRVVLAPYLCSHSIWQRSYYGFSWSTSLQHTDLSDLPFVTGSGSPFWFWEDNVHVNDFNNRYGADFEWFYGSFVARGEYLHVDWGNIERDFSPGVTRSAPFSANSAFIEALWVLTGEKKERNSLVKPFCNVCLNCCGWGAWEVGFRLESLWFNTSARRRGLARGASRISGLWLGLNWYLNPLYLAQINWAYYNFNSSLEFNNRRIKGENVLLFRFQGLY